MFTAKIALFLTFYHSACCLLNHPAKVTFTEDQRGEAKLHISSSIFENEYNLTRLLSGQCDVFQGNKAEVTVEVCPEGVIAIIKHENGLFLLKLHSKISQVHPLTRIRRDASVTLSNTTTISWSKLSREDWDGYVLGDFWNYHENKLNVTRKTRRGGEIVCNGPFCEYFKVKRDSQKWLEIAVFADDSVVQFHGDKGLERFVVTLLNVVSAIYSDPTLGAKLQFVLSNIIRVDKNEKVITEGNSKLSLANVNRWNKNYLANNPDSHHDIGIWLTRTELGGPSGYAPVAGVCDPSRSCALIKEEGLSSAFIIAHELGHLFGMSHDGDKTGGNQCIPAAEEGSVMAPLVGATFNYFHWSECSSDEYHTRSDDWQCLKNYPLNPDAKTFIGNTFIEPPYTLDQQCRMEFGEGFVFCESFQLTDPCGSLWCNNASFSDEPDTCKTKRSPPVEGTKCGEGKWCSDGKCQTTDNARSRESLRHNSLDGGWSMWSPWGDCSRTCGVGVRFRSRQCDSPRPAFGGEPCHGEREEFRVCSVDPCPLASDYRAEQCHTLFQTVNSIGGGNESEEFDYDDPSGRHLQTWLPFEAKDEEGKWGLICESIETRERYHAGKSVLDGTRCSYDHSSNICVQGLCVKLGCDKILGSPVKEDDCGICGGDNSECTKTTELLRGELETDRNASELHLERGSRMIRIEFAVRDIATLTVREESAGLQVFSGTLGLNGREFVSLGAKFLVNGSVIESKGPLQGRLIFTLSIGDFNAEEVIPYSIKLAYTASHHTQGTLKVEDTEWISHGWSKCTKDCGGGKQSILIKCVNKWSGEVLKRRICRELNTPMKIVDKRSKRCNEFTCDFVWTALPWEECSATCGLNGLRQRQSLCVPTGKNRSTEEQIWKFMVDPRKCPGQKPERFEPCNRVPCPGRWVSQAREWSECQGQPGACIGSQHKRLTCQPLYSESFFSCGIEPSYDKQCVLEDCHGECKDQSALCKDALLQRYCVLPGFRDRCCKSCRES